MAYTFTVRRHRSTMPGESRQLTFTGKLDLTVWLANTNGEDPVTFPWWPKDFPVTVPLWAEYLDDVSRQPIIGIPLDRAAYKIEARKPGRLWFCQIPLTELAKVTDASPDWFK